MKDPIPVTIFLHPFLYAVMKRWAAIDEVEIEEYLSARVNSTFGGRIILPIHKEIIAFAEDVLKGEEE